MKKLFLSLLLAITSAAHAETLWHADFETGNLSQLSGGQPWNSGDAKATIVKSPVHSGKYAVQCSITTSTNASAGVRLPVTNVPGSALLPDGYYSAWYNYPTKVTCAWNNVMQWKTVVAAGGDSNPSITIDEFTDNKGMHLNLQTKLDPKTGKFTGTARTLATAADVLPVGQWFQIETYYVWSTTGAGTVTTWLNGKQLWSVTDIYTQENHPQYKSPMQFSVNLYSEDTKPATCLGYIDDMAISTTPLGH